MKTLRVIEYLNNCDESEFDNLRHLTNNLETVFQLPEQDIVIAIACSDFWPWLVNDKEESE